MLTLGTFEAKATFSALIDHIASGEMVGRAWHNLLAIARAVDITTAQPPIWNSPAAKA